MPGFYTPTLTGTEDFVTDADLLIKIIEIAWPEISLDEWQIWLLRHVLERYPDDYPDPKKAGRLRFRQSLISLGRQNGKSVLAAVLGVYALLLHAKTPEVLSVASTVEQAQIVYNRVYHVIASNPTLASRYKITGTRGIRSSVPAKPGTYFVKTNREESLQGYPATFVVADEVHLLLDTTWTALQIAISAQTDGMLLGITTAGDSKSVLLKRLYDIGKDAGDERFFIALWEAPAHLLLTDPQFLISANPAIACGRVDLEQEMNALKSMPEHQARRYRGNQFVASESSWLSTSAWSGLAKGYVDPTEAGVVFAVDRDISWTQATITANIKREGKIHTEVVCNLVNPNIDRLEEVCQQLNKRSRRALFVMEKGVLHDLATRLRERGVKVEYLVEAQVKNACATSFALIAENRVSHAHDWIVAAQMPKAVTKNSGEGWRVSRRDSAGSIQAVLATVLGIYAAETYKARGVGVFVG